MNCKNCGEPLLDGQTLCLNCGAPVEEKSKHRSAAQKHSKEKLTKSKSFLNGRNKAVVLLLCFFFGLVGAHNFYMGELTKGLRKVLASVFCGIGFFLAIIDFVKIIANRYNCEPDI